MMEIEPQMHSMMETKQHLLAHVYPYKERYILKNLNEKFHFIRNILFFDKNSSF